MKARSYAFRVLSAAAVLLACSALSVKQASAHVVYSNPLYADPTITDPLTGFNGAGLSSPQSRTVSSNTGWAAGQNNTTGGDSHNARFLYFNLAEPQIISFGITSTGANSLNPGYSIYSGTVPNVSHDGENYTGQTPFAPWSPFAASDAGSDPGSEKWGEFRSNANVTMSNGTDVGTMVYTGLSGSTENLETLNGEHLLGPGLYTLVVGGANSDAATDLLNAYKTADTTAIGSLRAQRAFDITFNVAPVPIPAAAWLFGSGVVSLVALARRRMSA